MCAERESRGGGQTEPGCSSVAMTVRSLSDDQSASYTTLSPTSVLVLFTGVCVCFVFKRRKKKFYTTDWLIYFYCTRMKRMLKDTTFKKNKLVLALSKCFLGVCGRGILYLG